MDNKTGPFLECNMAFEFAGTATNFKYWKNAKGQTIINELCRCGALRTDHYPSIPGMPASYGHGYCEKTGCEKFTWVSHVFAPSNKKGGA